MHTMPMATIRFGVCSSGLRVPTLRADCGGSFSYADEQPDGQ
jgi:hypothetical protein